ncbi:MAG: heparinase II/III family protein [Armatimonadota bacterium]|jgi:heparin/heparan-sulfate lyase
MSVLHIAVVAIILVAAMAQVAGAQELPEWAAGIRTDHPRLFFNADTWPAVRARALGPERDWYDYIKARVDRLQEQIGDDPTPEVRELGYEAAQAAFIYLMTGDAKYLDLAKKALETSLAFYEQCFEERKSVNWYSTSRVHATLAWDWLYNDLTDAERQEYMSRVVQVLQKVYTAQPRVYRENMSGYSTGFYGVTNCKWFVGCAALGAGIEEQLVNEWLLWGYSENMKLLAHRKSACGDDGGSASPTLGYAFGAYPWSEQNFFYTWLSATGENIAPDWPHSAWLANYVIWNWIETGDAPMEFGYGDTPHTDNRLRASQLFTHMANIRHLYGEEAPEAAALARHLQDKLPNKAYSRSWFIYPFLLSGLEHSPPPFEPERLPHARNFENMGQLFMRSGAGPEDTYCLFTCGGILRQHRHFDALNFVIYHRGHLALDSGTRYKEFDNGQHLANYYAQTVAHNCVAVHQPGEPPARYWGGTVEGCHGGQHKQLGSVLKAFETNDRYVYVAGDATECYQHGGVEREGQPDLPEKVTLATRQLVFLMPNHFVIFDRVTSTDAAYKKDWLLHTAYEPVIEGTTIRADHQQGRMFCRTILPADAVLTPVGGPGKEFLAAGKNWDIVTDGLKPENLAMMGQWRVEVSPGAPRTEDVFLHVIQVGDQGLAAMDAAELIQGPGVAGVRLTIGDRTSEVTFNTRGDLGGHIKLSGPALDGDLTTEVTPQVGILATPT